MRAYGWQSATEVNDTEAEQIRQWASAILAGASLRSLAVAANETGVATTSGSGKWAPLTIKRALLSDRNVETIIDQSDAEELVDVLNAPDRARFTSTDSGPSSWLLRLAVCGVCGEPLWMQRFAKRPPDMKCTAAGCGRVAIRQGGLEGNAAKHIVDKLRDPHSRAVLAQKSVLPPEHWEAQREMAQTRMIHLAQTFGGCESTRVAFDAGVAVAREVITEADNALEHISVIADLPAPEKVVDWWDQLPNDRRADYARLLIDHVSVMRRSDGPDRLRYFWR